MFGGIIAGMLPGIIKGVGGLVGGLFNKKSAPSSGTPITGGIAAGVNPLGFTSSVTPDNRDEFTKAYDKAKKDAKITGKNPPTLEEFAAVYFAPTQTSDPQPAMEDYASGGSGDFVSSVVDTFVPNATLEQKERYGKFATWGAVGLLLYFIFSRK